MNATTLCEVLQGISKKHDYSKSLEIEFETKSGIKQYLRYWLYPYYYNFGFKGRTLEFSGHKNDFRNIFRTEAETSFGKWKSVQYKDDEHDNWYHPTYNIWLDTEEYFSPKQSHYTGIVSVCWMDYVDKGYKEYFDEQTKRRKERETWWKKVKTTIGA